MTASSSKGPQQQKANLVHNSAPPKMQESKSEKCHDKGIDQNTSVKIDSQLTKVVLPENVVEETADRVHIPDNFVESDTKSDTLSEKLRRIDAYNEDIQGDLK